MSNEFVLDTNVISEVLRVTPDPQVVAWMREHDDSTLLTTVTRAELRYGVARMPRGARKARVSDLVEAVIAEFRDDTVAFDQASADAYGELMAERERSGRVKSMADTMIAAICLAHGYGLATRNIADFEDAGIVVLVNPFAQN